MPKYLAPGFLVQKASFGGRPIRQVSTGHALFLGHAPDQAAPTGIPHLVRSASAFAAKFGGATPRSTALSLAIEGFFQNGGQRCHVLGLPAWQARLSRSDLATTADLDDVDLLAAPGFADPGSLSALVAYAEDTGRFAVLDGPNPVPDIASLQGATALRPQAPSGQAAIYLPWLEVRDPVRGARVACPPSGHICGLFARTDHSRGVWKAPAGRALRRVAGCIEDLDRPAIHALNAAHWNPIASSPRGVLVWGARTMSRTMPEFRYVPARRTLNMLKRSLEKGLTWTMFEPHAPVLWRDVEQRITVFLNQLHRQGAFAGTTSQDAYFVRCDHSTMSQSDIDRGRLVAQVGVALSKPSEFTLLRFQGQADHRR